MVLYFLREQEPFIKWQWIQCLLLCKRKHDMCEDTCPLSTEYEYTDNEGIKDPLHNQL